MGTKLKSSQKKGSDFQVRVADIQRALRQAAAACTEIGRGLSTSIQSMNEAFGHSKAVRKLKRLSGAAAKTLVLDSYEEAVGTVAFVVSRFERRADEDALNIREKSSKRHSWRNLEQGRYHAQVLRDWMVNPTTPLPLLEFTALSAFVGVDELPKMGRKGEQHSPCHNVELERLCRAAHSRETSHTWVRNQVVLNPKYYGFPGNRYADKSKTLDRGIRSALKRLGITLVKKSLPD